MGTVGGEHGAQARQVHVSAVLRDQRGQLPPTVAQASVAPDLQALDPPDQAAQGHDLAHRPSHLRH